MSGHDHNSLYDIAADVYAQDKSLRQKAEKAVKKPKPKPSR